MRTCLYALSFFFFNDTATTEIYTLSLHDALPISHQDRPAPTVRRSDCPTDRRGLGGDGGRARGAEAPPRPGGVRALARPRRRGARGDAGAAPHGARARPRGGRGVPRGARGRGQIGRAHV